MGYYSEVYFKTTTEGYVLLRQFNDRILPERERPLAGMTIQKTESGFYKISTLECKWYETYKDVQNFYKAMKYLEEQDIPYAFIRLGEDDDDIEIKSNHTEDTPDEICSFNLNRIVSDDYEEEYEFVEEVE